MDRPFHLVVVMVVASLLVLSAPHPAHPSSDLGPASPSAVGLASGAPASTASLLGAGPTPRALVVEGEYDALRVPSHADLSPRGVLTIELWVKRVRSSGCGTLVGKGRRTAYWFGICDGRLRFSSNGGESSEGSSVLPEGRWTHVAVTYDGTTVSFYVNGALDRSGRDPIGPLAANSEELVVGADTALGTFFPGRIDQVRLWNVARSAAEVRDGMLRTFSPQPGLVAQWSLDGNGRDLVGMHDGRAINGGTFTSDGVLPRDLTVPLSVTTPAVDGRCDPAEYGGAERVAIDSVDAPTVYVQATSVNVNVCFVDMPRATSPNTFVAVYLDRNLSRDARSQPGDYRFIVRNGGTTVAEEGDGVGGYRLLNLVAGTWDGARVIDTDRWSAELRIPRSLLEAPSDPNDPYAFGLTLSHGAVKTTGDDQFWPVGAVGASPAGWATTTLAESAGIPPRVVFHGTVVRPTREDGTRGLGGVGVQLLAAEKDRPLRLLDTTITDGGGGYELESQGAPPDSYLVREIDPRGVTSVAADAGQDGVASGANLLRYDVDEDEPATDRIFSAGRFVDAAGPAAPQLLEAHYLIVYSEPVSEQDLWPITRAKARQGFRVVTMSTQMLDRQGAGRDLAERIFLWLKGYWEAVEPEPVYALLVGRGDRVPVRDIGWMDNDHRDPALATYYPGWPTDWYYGDVDSDWDADGDGYYGEFMRCRPGETYADPEDKDRDCPEAGSLSREGPYGALRGSADDFQTEISVGRIAVNEPGEVRRALEASVAAETSASLDKRRALLAGSFWSFDGQSWVEDLRRSVAGGESRADAWLATPWDGERPFGDDTADHLDVELRALLAGSMSQVTRLYETTSPGGDPSLVPTTRLPDGALTPERLAEAWQSGLQGLVNAAGRGAPDGLFGGRWVADWDTNGRIDQPARPERCAGQPVGTSGQIGPPCSELLVEAYLHAGLPAPGGVPPVVVANGASTGAVGWATDGVDSGGNVIGLAYGPEAIAGSLPARGRAAAWVGALSAVGPGDHDRFQDVLNRHLLETPLRLGDAMGLAASTLARENPYDMRSYNEALFGDPGLAYWGNAVDSAGAWPQDGRDWRATGGSPQAGLVTPERMWAANQLSPSTPPSIGRAGDLFVAGSGQVMQLSLAGTVLAQTPLGAPPGTPVRYAPAIGTDAVYVAAGNTLYSFSAADLEPREPVPMPGLANVSGPPRIGPDGVLWVPTENGLVRVYGAGRTETVGDDGAQGSSAFLPTGEVVWSTAGGVLMTYALDRMGVAKTAALDGRDLGDITGPAVSAAGTVYVGSANGRLYGMPRDGSPWQVDTGAAVRARPAIGPGGAVYVANVQGTVRAFAPESSTELWKMELGAPVEAGPTALGDALLLSAGSTLFALNVATGDPLWSLGLGGPADERSVPIVGADRTVYVMRSDRTLVAVRESGWLAAPTGVTLTTGPAVATVQWRDNSSDEAFFRIELCDLDDECTLAGSTGPNTSRLEVRRLPFEDGAPFYARVQAVGRADATGTARTGAGRASARTGGEATRGREPDANLGSEYAYSDVRTVVGRTPSTPQGVAAEPTGADGIEITWSYAGDPGQLVGFVLRRRRGDEGAYSPVAFLGAGARRHVDRDLLPDTAYRYELVATNEAGESDAAAVSASTRPATLRAPSALTVLTERDRMVVRWRDNAFNESGYVVERQAPGAARFEVVGRLGPAASRFVDTVYLADGVYGYRIKAIGKDSDSPYALVSARFGATRTGIVYLPLASTFRR